MPLRETFNNGSFNYRKGPERTGKNQKEPKRTKKDRKGLIFDRKESISVTIKSLYSEKITTNTDISTVCRLAIHEVTKYSSIGAVQ